MKQHKPVLLIIEDSEEDFIATQRALKSQEGGLANTIVHCEDGEEALDYMFKRGKYNNADEYPLPNLILLDLNLPMIDGREVLQEIKSHDHLKHIPVIILTTSLDNSDIERCYHLGANSYVQKPVKLDNFIQAIAKIKDYWLEIAVLPNNEK